MTEVTLDRKSLLGFIAGFGEVDDLRLSVAGTRITGEVGFSTHYLRRTLVVDEDSITKEGDIDIGDCLLYTSPSPRDVEESRMPSSA